MWCWLPCPPLLERDDGALTGRGYGRVTGKKISITSHAFVRSKQESHLSRISSARYKFGWLRGLRKLLKGKKVWLRRPGTYRMRNSCHPGRSTRCRRGPNRTARFHPAVYPAGAGFSLTRPFAWQLPASVKSYFHPCKAFGRAAFVRETSEQFLV